MAAGNAADPNRTQAANPAAPSPHPLTVTAGMRAAINR